MIRTGCGRELEGTDDVTLWRNSLEVRRVEAPGGFWWQGLAILYSSSASSSNALQCCGLLMSKREYHDYCLF